MNYLYRLHSGFRRLYVHVPFCVRKCDYCAFYSIPIEDSLEDAYLAKMAEEIEKKSGLCEKLSSVYIGGGAPTTLSATSIERLFALISRHFKYDDSCEISVECNPESLTDTKAGLLANFANRVSVGVQSFDAGLRRILGRRAENKDIARAFRLLRKHGIENLSCDLINSIPGQSLQDYECDLRRALELDISHLSSYSLTIEEGTLLAAKKIAADENLEIETWNLGDETLSSAGMNKYEISNFCRKGFECAHNLEIWFGDKYLGLGPSAASFDGEKRWTEIANFAKWAKGAAPEDDIISRKRRAAEILAFGFRTLRKWTDEKFYRRSKFRLSDWNGILAALDKDGLIKYRKNSAISTKKGLLLWNNLAEKIIGS